LSRAKEENEEKKVIQRKEEKEGKKFVKLIVIIPRTKSIFDEKFLVVFEWVF
jgi:hypothetical protein